MCRKGTWRVSPDSQISAAIKTLDDTISLYPELLANDPASGPGWISEYPLRNAAPATTITNRISCPAFCAIDAKGDLVISITAGIKAAERNRQGGRSARGDEGATLQPDQPAEYNGD
jgi:hypothetical protein